MAEHALKILKDDETLLQFKRNARQRAEDFDIHAILPQYEAVYERLREAKLARS